MDPQCNVSVFACGRQPEADRTACVSCTETAPSTQAIGEPFVHAPPGPCGCQGLALNGRASALVDPDHPDGSLEPLADGQLPGPSNRNCRSRGSRNIGGRMRIRQFTSTTTPDHLEILGSRHRSRRG
jgi:hypothetical protein